MTQPDDILGFWFAEGRAAARPVWFQRDARFDAEIRARFGGLLEPARNGALDEWTTRPEGALALLLLLDQFPRNLFRGHRDAFASDPQARVMARQAVLGRRQDLALPPVARVFLYLPFEHSEAMEDQNLSVALFEGLRDHPAQRAPGGTIDYAWRHWRVIRRFGRFPHRNAALGRTDTPEEALYLAQPGAGF
ncbi:DUF924 family protein [Roseomonas sp. E05]|uniref:DUF924 family protein n=1 Tax=Roseomonas sp. E05 TaxID=3046310 RepID=UPI0024B9137C|nr:DUF924 family protein [Roseomonas sp. E05]MDJ0390979.1 DUF924 family protein [Roseomonas sp. E05]